MKACHCYIAGECSRAPYVKLHDPGGIGNGRGCLIRPAQKLSLLTSRTPAILSQLLRCLVWNSSRPGAWIWGCGLSQVVLTVQLTPNSCKRALQHISDTIGQQNSSRAGRGITLDCALNLFIFLAAESPDYNYGRCCIHQVMRVLSNLPAIGILHQTLTSV